MKRTLILLSAKRCGSTAVFQMFQRHPDVGLCHVDRSIDNWEANFWNLAWDAIHGAAQPLVERLAVSLPFLKPPHSFAEATVFELWDAILARQGPIVFDKSPQYLGNRGALDLIYKYKSLGNDVRIFAMIRDPRDAIASQFELWQAFVPDDAPEKREAAWLDKYGHLEELLRRDDIPLFRYEDFATAPNCYAAMMYRFCGLRDHPASYAHVRRMSANRYSISADPQIRAWKPSPAFRAHVVKYGYRVPQVSARERPRWTLPLTPAGIFQSAVRCIKRLAAVVAIGVTPCGFPTCLG